MKKHLHKLALLSPLIALLPSCLVGPEFTGDMLGTPALQFLSPPLLPKSGEIPEASDTSHAGPSDAWNHWNAVSLSPRFESFWLGYDQDLDGPYLAAKWREDAKHINRNLARMFFNFNEESTSQASWGISPFPGQITTLPKDIHEEPTLHRSRYPSKVPALPANLSYILDS